MEVNTKLKEMEEEIKVLKAEIRNVLLDIREVILERTNPLDEGGETQTIRMDLRTTAQAMASEAAAHEARAAQEAVSSHTNGASPEEHADGYVPPHVHAESLPQAEDADIRGNDPAGTEDETPADQPPPKVIRRDPKELKMLAEERENQNTLEETDVSVPPIYRREGVSPYRVEFAPLGAPLSGGGSISAWLTEALATVGPRELSRLIAIHRSWGNMPPNISRALAYIQELLDETVEPEPAWLRVMQKLDALASL